MNVLLTAYFNTFIDEQRDVYWEASDKDIQPLIESAKCPVIVLNDCLPEKNTKKVKYVRHTPSRQPYFERWYAYYKYLNEHPEIQNLFCVDATDVLMVQDPFGKLKDRIYVGDEDQFLGTDWVIENHQELFLKDFAVSNRKKQLLNVGILGGSRQNVLRVIRAFMEYTDNYHSLGKTDMGVMNYLFYTRFKGRITHGAPLNSLFRAYEERDDVWFIHK